jgi:hypothetical protein
MLPSVLLPNVLVSGGVNDEMLNPSTISYLKELKTSNPFQTLAIPLEVLRFIEIMKPMDMKGERIFHATESSRIAMKFLKEQEEVTMDATILFSDLPLYETIGLVRVQRLGSTMVTILGEMTMKSDIQLLYLLCGMYKSVRIQSLTVSHSDSERVVIAKDLVHRITLKPPPYEMEMSRFFLTKLDELNSMHGQTRLEMARTPQKDKTTNWMTTFLNG